MVPPGYRSAFFPWSIGAGVHVEPHSHANEQIVWMLKGRWPSYRQLAVIRGSAGATTMMTSSQIRIAFGGVARSMPSAG
jgi:hypothetical protein